ncbi:hypothetical protein THAOC_28975, partial [Thalassiosira oceanica]
GVSGLISKTESGVFTPFRLEIFPGTSTRH